MERPEPRPPIKAPAGVELVKLDEPLCNVTTPSDFVVSLEWGELVLHYTVRDHRITAMLVSLPVLSA